MKFDAKKFIISIIIPFIAGAIGGYATYPNIATWYVSLSKPSFSPPNSIFGPVWTFLYITMGIALYLVWTSETRVKKQGAFRLFGVQLALNTLWSLAFFGLQSPMLGLVVIIPLWLSIALTVLSFDKISKNAAALLIPYLLWVTFASVLNFAVFMLN